MGTYAAFSGRLPGRCLCAGTRLQQPQSEHVKSCEKRDHQQDPARLSLDKAHKRIRISQELGFNAICFVAKVSQDRAPERRTSDGDDTENAEVHPNDPRRDRDQMANHGKQTREKDAPCFIARQPILGLFQFFRTDENEPTVLYDKRTSNEP